MTSQSSKWGDKDFLLTKPQKKNFSEWVNHNRDYTITTRIFKPIYRIIERFVPQNLAPNVITLCGFLFVLNGVYLCFRYIELYPNTISAISMILSLGYQILNGIDGIHAETTGNVSNVGHLFSRFCTGIGALLQVLILTYVVNMTDLTIQWYFVQIVALVVFLIHVNGYRTGIVRYYAFFGAQEIMFLFQLIILLRICGVLFFVYDFYFDVFFPYINDNFLHMPKSRNIVINGAEYENSVLLLIHVLRFVYYVLYSISILWIFRLGKSSTSCNGPEKKNEEGKKEEGKKEEQIPCIPLSVQKSTRNSLIIVFLIRGIPGLLLIFNLYTEIDVLDIVSDGLFLSMVSFELIVSKMCRKELHSWVILFAVASLINHILIYFMVLFHFVIITFELATFLNLPVFSMNRNVYIDGVFDMCHYGHFKYFERALSNGTRLFVGVCSDKDVSGYKRKPIMNVEERAAVVATCKSVYKVIPNCPLCVSAELIDKYNIHVVLCSVEYDKEDDKYYKEARKRGILKTMPRTQGMSTSELIRRIERKCKNEMREDYPYIFDQKGKIKSEESLSPSPSMEDVTTMKNN